MYEGKKEIRFAIMEKVVNFIEFLITYHIIVVGVTVEVKLLLHIKALCTYISNVRISEPNYVKSKRLVSR